MPNSMKANALYINPQTQVFQPMKAMDKGFACFGT